jgi:hypothetical protein
MNISGLPSTTILHIQPTGSKEYEIVAITNEKN